MALALSSPACHLITETLLQNIIFWTLSMSCLPMFLFLWSRITNRSRSAIDSFASHMENSKYRTKNHDFGFTHAHRYTEISAVQNIFDAFHPILFKSCHCPDTICRNCSLSLTCHIKSSLRIELLINTLCDLGGYISGMCRRFMLDEHKSTFRF